MADELLSGIFLSCRCLIRRWGLSVGSSILLVCAILSLLILADAIRVVPQASIRSKGIVDCFL